MKGWAIVYRRELAGLFLAPLAWVLLCLTLLYNGYYFLRALQLSGGEVNGALMGFMSSWPFWILMTLLPPLLTMRMISEESRNGLLEYLLTAPVGDGAVVLGKALAAITFFAIVWFCIPIYGLGVALAGADPDWGLVLTNWMGAVLTSAVFCALGLVASALSATPVLAAFLATVLNLLVLFLPAAQGQLGLTGELSSWIGDKMDVLKHFQSSFLTGALDSTHLVFFVAWTAVLLFITVRLLERRRWLG